MGSLINEQPTYDHTLDDLSLKMDRKFILIFILNFFRNSYLLHTESDWQTIYTVEFLKKIKLCVCEVVEVLEAKGWFGNCGIIFHATLGI